MRRRRRALEKSRRATAAAIAVGVAFLGCGKVDDPSLRPVTDPRFSEPPPVLRARPSDPNRNVFWGDLHIHTSFSYDAYTFGVRALPDDAYRFSKGETIQHAVGYPIRLARPLDFSAVTDHAEYLGVARHRGESAGGDEPDLREILETGSRWKIMLNFFDLTINRMRSGATRHQTFGGGKSAEIGSRAWREIIASAERHNEPGRFTAFIGYEWSSMPDERNLHRNVIYRSDHVPDVPFSSIDSENPEDLWRALEEQRRAGIRVLAIPHNANVSDGRMYDRVTFDGSPLSARYAEVRMENEPISEILQVKGQSETHPLLSSEDEFAGFELYDQILSAWGGMSEPHGSYARDALKVGLAFSARQGFNPYRFGVIGSSDGHNASSPVEENAYHGKLPLIDGTVATRLGENLMLPDSQNRGLRWSAMGLAAVFAEENTRASLFDAMRRKETYATSGSRINVRLFGGWELDGSWLEAHDWIERSYASGVPMGGTLYRGEVATAPRFLVVALKDPIGANLDRIQIVKGWVDSSGATHEKIFDVAASDGRRPEPGTHRVGPVGSTVDVAAASYANSIGATRLQAAWTDPEHDTDTGTGTGTEAFYYARVIEIPTPRWSTYDARAMGIPAPDPAEIQERAITSAIWVRP